MKKLIFLVVVLVGVSFASCDKSKTCNCRTEYSMEGDADEDFSGMSMDGYIEETVNIDKGKCSDLDASAKSSIEGMSVIETRTCKEQ